MPTWCSWKDLERWKWRPWKWMACF